MKDLLQEGRRIQELFKKRVLSEALNKDIKMFGQDVDAKLKEGGFKTLIVMKKELSTSQIDELKKVQGLIGFEVDAYNQYVSSNVDDVQTLRLLCNTKDFPKVKKIVEKFQLAKYTGQAKLDPKTWATKQVLGALNPGDIYKFLEYPNNGGVGEFVFMRQKKVTTTSQTTDSSGKKTSKDITTNIF